MDTVAESSSSETEYKYTAFLWTAFCTQLVLSQTRHNQYASILQDTRNEPTPDGSLFAFVVQGVPKLMSWAYISRTEKDIGKLFGGAFSHFIVFHGALDYIMANSYTKGEIEIFGIYVNQGKVHYSVKETSAYLAPNVRGKKPSVTDKLAK
ncbi:hypothetical protein NQ317_015607 [Molorchus minor]|uniref:Uncharacterized protein n=1 Tax=Molorchus minor TaxID=1323400 RepID=A0ABQ9K0Y3_9CUCU|nr:hypothetical protein NQ317_015607 [Molorchus minor]